MSKKIIIVGPPAAGKTTLRKVFFEGESSSQLLEYALAPTHGQESILLEFQDQIGVFDLAGQENNFWLEINKNSIFNETKIIIIVIDVSVDLKENLSFTQKVLNLRNKITPKAICYLLVHKIDLIDQKELQKNRDIMHKLLFKESLLKISYTSIQREYFRSTFLLFIDILRTCISKEVAIMKNDLNFFKNSIYAMYLINSNSSISREELQYTLKISNQNYYNIENTLKKQGLAKDYNVDNHTILKLTDAGAEYFDKLLSSFSPTYFNSLNETDIALESSDEYKKYRFLGFIISTKSGVPLISSEIYDGFFESFLKSEQEGVSKEHDLIPMFISALESFSDEINIQNLSGFEFRGSNVNVKTFNFDLVTITLFTNSNVNPKTMKDYIHNWFESLVNDNRTLIQKAIDTCNNAFCESIRDNGKDWLININKRYDALALNLEIFDMKETKNLYEKLDGISLNDKTLSSKKIKKIKKLKRDLIKASLDEDYYEIKEISKRVKGLFV